MWKLCFEDLKCNSLHKSLYSLVPAGKITCKFNNIFVNMVWKSSDYFSFPALSQVFLFLFIFPPLDLFLAVFFPSTLFFVVVVVEFIKYYIFYFSSMFWLFSVLLCFLVTFLIVVCLKGVQNHLSSVEF